MQTRLKRLTVFMIWGQKASGVKVTQRKQAIQSIWAICKSHVHVWHGSVRPGPDHFCYCSRPLSWILFYLIFLQNTCCTVVALTDTQKQNTRPLEQEENRMQCSSVFSEDVKKFNFIQLGIVNIHSHSVRFLFLFKTQLSRWTLTYFWWLI